MKSVGADVTQNRDKVNRSGIPNFLEGDVVRQSAKGSRRSELN
jgi:hypothetical protein